jgi:hypothetical protein
VTQARAIRDKAEAMLRPGDELAVATDASADPVLIGVATPVQSLVIAVDNAEIGEGWQAQVDLARRMGFELREPSAIEKLRRAK